MVAAVLVFAASAAACGGGGGGGTDNNDAAAPVPTTTAPVATTAATGTTLPTTNAPGTNLSLHMTDLRVGNSEESDNAVRVLLPAGVTTVTVSITGLPTPNQVISVCQANDLQQRLPTAACRMPAAGATATLPLGNGATGVEIVQVGVNGSGPGASVTALSDVIISYAASSRDVSVRLPQIEAGDTGNKPTFTLTPPGPTGAYKAVLNWTVVQVFGGTSSSAQIDLVQNGNSVNKASGGGLQVQLTGNAPSPGEAGFRVQNTGAGALVSVRLVLTMP